MFSILSITENTSTFKMYEDKILDFTKAIGSKSIKKQLEEIDDKILKIVNKKIFRNKGKRRLDYKTKLSEVEIYRRIYVINEELIENIDNKENNIFYIVSKNRLENGKKSVCFLDEFLKLKEFGKISTGVVDLILKYISDNSYRKTADIVNEITGLHLTGQAVWLVVQKVGYKLKEKEKLEQEKLEEDELELGKEENHVLFNELDGVYIKLQGKDKKEAIKKYKERNQECVNVPKSVSKKEIKVVSIYEGFEKVSKKRIRLKNKKVFAQVIDNVNIKEVTNTYISKTYDKSKLNLIVKNSDGGTWTKEKNNKKVIYQIDLYHIKEKINSCIRDKDDIEKMNGFLKDGKYEEMMKFAEELKYTYDGEFIEVEKLNALQKYIKTNSRYFRRYQDTELFKNVKQKGNWYRNLGTQESTNYQIITKRMKRRRMSFSINGADNLSRVLAMINSYDFKDINEELSIKSLPKKLINETEKYINEINENILKQEKINQKHKYKKIKYNDSFDVRIPGIEIKTNNMIEIRGILDRSRVF